MRLKRSLACVGLLAGTIVALHSTTAAAAPTRYEAETAPATCTGTIDSNHTGFSGSGFCNGNNAVGYGQVNTRELWRLIPSLKAQGTLDPVSGEVVTRNEHVANVMLADNGDCVALTTQMMVEFGNRRAKVLSGWANGATSIVNKWVACEQKLSIEDPYSDDWVKEPRYGHVIPRRAIVVEALNLARPGASLDVVGCVPEW